MYDYMADMFLMNPRMRNGWKKDRVIWWLQALDKRNQLMKIMDYGEVKGFVGWIYICREDFDLMKRRSLKFITNIGDCICPLFVATDGTVAFGTMRRIAEEMRKHAPILSFRKGRGLELGGTKNG